MLTASRLAALVAATGLAAVSADAQDIVTRAPQQLDTTSTGIGLNPSVANDGLLTAVSFFDNGTDTVSVVFSDGRGVDWSAPIRVDDDTTDPPATKISQYDSCLVIGDNTYVVWKDERLGSSLDRIAFTRSVNGGIFEANQLLDEGYGGIGKVFAWRFAGAQGPTGDGSDDYLFVVQNSDGPVSDDECFLVWSDDSGATWQGPLKVGGDSAGGFDVDGVAVAADGSVAHIMWDDNTSSGSTSFDSVYYRRFDATTGLLGPTIQLDSTDTADAGDSAPTGTFNFEIDADGDLVVAAWPEERFDATDEEVRVAVSTDGGATFLPDEYVGDYSTVLDDDVDFLTAAISDGNIVVAYTDNREDLAGGGIGTGSGSLDQAYVSVAIDPLNNPLVFTEVAQVSTPDGASGVRIATDGGPDVGLTWTTDLGSEQDPGAAFSQDGGLTWTGGIILSDPPGIDADIAEIGYNAAYGNFIHAWLSNDIGTNNVFAGGYRPATVGANGFVAGNTAVNFDFANLITNGDNVNAAVLLSTSPGSFFLGGLDMGLTFDPVTSLGLSFVTFLSAPVAPDGSASTPVVPVNLPAGITLYATGIGFKAGPATIDRVTDVIEIAF